MFYEDLSDSQTKNLRAMDLIPAKRHTKKSRRNCINAHRHN